MNKHRVSQQRKSVNFYQANCIDTVFHDYTDHSGPTNVADPQYPLFQWLTRFIVKRYDICHLDENSRMAVLPNTI